MRSFCELWAWVRSLDANGWVAISTFLLVLATITLVVVGWVQVSSIRKEAKIARTLAMCDRYDTDPVLDRYLRALNKAKASGGDFSKNPGKYANEVSTVLNYFDSLAVGIERGLYDESLANVHNRDILSEYVEDYLGSEALPIDGISPDEFPRLLALNAKWSRPPRQRRFFRRCT